MKRSNRVKLFGTLVVLLMVLALAAAGTYAWFTLSKQGEVSNVRVSFEKDGDEWPFYIIQQPATLSQTTTTQDILDLEGWQKDLILAEVADASGNMHPIQESYQLRPVTTADGVNWYTAVYGSSGSVMGLSNEELDAIANINRQNVHVATESDEIPANYLYYYDVWIKTESNENDYNLHLSNPLTMESVSADEIAAGFGTYIFPGQIPDNATNSAALKQAAYDASTCIRMGFLIYDQDPDGLVSSETPGTFWIYEPNCDQRATGFEEYTGSGVPHSDYNAQLGITYIYNSEDHKTLKVGEHAAYASSSVVDSLLPVYHEDTNTTTYESRADYTIRQYHSERDDDGTITSLGRFLPIGGVERPGYEGIDTPPMVRVSKGHPQHIRVFIWLEGQDIDCWNSTMSGQMDIHLEFRGEKADN